MQVDRLALHALDFLTRLWRMSGTLTQLRITSEVWNNKS